MSADRSMTISDLVPGHSNQHVDQSKQTPINNRRSAYDIVQSMVSNEMTQRWRDRQVKSLLESISVLSDESVEVDSQQPTETDTQSPNTSGESEQDIERDQMSNQNKRSDSTQSTLQATVFSIKNTETPEAEMPMSEVDMTILSIPLISSNQRISPEATTGDENKLELPSTTLSSSVIDVNSPVIASTELKSQTDKTPLLSEPIHLPILQATEFEILQKMKQGNSNSSAINAPLKRKSNEKLPPIIPPKLQNVQKPFEWRTAVPSITRIASNKGISSETSTAFSSSVTLMNSVVITSTELKSQKDKTPLMSQPKHLPLPEATEFKIQRKRKQGNSNLSSANAPLKRKRNGKQPPIIPPKLQNVQKPFGRRTTTINTLPMHLQPAERCSIVGNVEKRTRVTEINVTAKSSVENNKNIPSSECLANLQRNGVTVTKLVRRQSPMKILEPYRRIFKANQIEVRLVKRE